MELHEIRYFLPVIRMRNFTRAAEQCNVTQPALTSAYNLNPVTFSAVEFDLVHRVACGAGALHGRRLLPGLGVFVGGVQRARIRWGVRGLYYRYVVSNLVGRLISASVAGEFGLSVNFLAFAVLNLLDPALIWVTLRHRSDVPVPRGAFAVGFCILFVFLGTFIFVNFALVRALLNVSPMALGVIYLPLPPRSLPHP